MKRIAGRIGPRSKPRGRRSVWGDWRPFNAAPLAWDQVTEYTSGTQVSLEIAGRSLTADSISSVPFDPGAQLDTGSVTLVEEETFDVQVSGHIDVWAVTGPGIVHLYHGLYLGDYIQAAASFYVPPAMNLPQDAADTDWKQYSAKAGTLFPAVLTATAKADAYRMNFAATQRIGQGKGLSLAMMAIFVDPVTLYYASYLKYRIRRNVD